MDIPITVPESEWLKDGGKSRLCRSPSTPMRPIPVAMSGQIRQRSQSSPLVNTSQTVSSTAKTPSSMSSVRDSQNTSALPAEKCQEDCGGLLDSPTSSASNSLDQATDRAVIENCNNALPTATSAGNKRDGNLAASSKNILHVPPTLKDPAVDDSRPPVPATSTALPPRHRSSSAASGHGALVEPSSNPGPPLTPQQRRLQALHTRNVTLQSTLDELMSERDKLAVQLRDLTMHSEKVQVVNNDGQQLSKEELTKVMSDAKATIKEHITLLHRYNDIRDVAQGLMGMIADQRAVRMRDVQEDFGVDEKD